MRCLDDKACTFVGTAAYVPPEVLNSSPATFGYDARPKLIRQADT